MPKSTFFNLSTEKQRRIIEGAKNAFSKKHYNEVTVDSIVEYSNIPKGSFYQYFLNKDDLFKYIFQNLGTDKSNELIDEIEKASDKTFSELMIRVIARANQFENQDDIMIGLKGRFLNECPQEIKNEIILDVIPKTMDLFEKIIKIYINNGEFRNDINVKTAAFILTSTVISFENINLEKENDYSEVMKNVCDLLEIGLRK